MIAENGAQPHNHSEPGYLDKLKADTGFDLIVEMLANVNLGHDLEILRPRGRVMVVLFVIFFKQKVFS